MSKGISGSSVDLGSIIRLPLLQETGIIHTGGIDTSLALVPTDFNINIPTSDITADAVVQNALTVNDITVALNVVQAEAYDGAGIIVTVPPADVPNKTLTYDKTNGHWETNTDFSVSAGNVYKVDNTQVLSGSALGSGITSSSLTSVGSSLVVNAAANARELNVKGSIQLQSSGGTGWAIESTDNALIIKDDADALSALRVFDTADNGISITGKLHANDTTESTSSVTGGTQLLGGLGVAKNIHSGGDISIATGKQYEINSVKILDATSISTAVQGSIVQTGALNIGSITSGYGSINTGDSTITTSGAVSTGALTASGVVNLDNTTASTSVSTGALILDGGMGVAKDVHCVNVDCTTALKLGGVDINVAGTLSNVSYTSGVAATDSVVGDLTVAGDVQPNAASLYISGDRSTGNIMFVSSNFPEGALSTTEPVDGNVSTQTGYFSTNQTILTSHFIRFDFQQRVKITDMKLYSGSFAAPMATWKGQISDDNFVSDITDISSSFALGGQGSSPTTFNMDITGNYAFKRYFQIVGVSGTANANSRFDEFEFDNLTLDNLQINASVNLSSGEAYRIAGNTMLNATSISEAVQGSIVKTGALNIGTVTSGFGSFNNGSSSTSTGALTASGIVNFDNTTDSTSASTGAVLIDGGVGIGKNLHIGDDCDLNTAKNYRINNVSVLNASTLGSSVQSSSLTTVSALDSGSVTSNFGNFDNGSSSVSTGAITASGVANFDNTTLSSSVSTGALVVDGGVGVAKELFVGLTGNFAGILNADNTTESTTSSTGGVILDGGLGVAKNITAAGSVSGASFKIGVNDINTNNILTNVAYEDKNNVYSGSAEFQGGVDITNAGTMDIDSAIRGRQGTFTYSNHLASGDRTPYPVATQTSVFMLNTTFVMQGNVHDLFDGNTGSNAITLGLDSDESANPTHLVSGDRSGTSIMVVTSSVDGGSLVNAELINGDLSVETGYFGGGAVTDSADFIRFDFKVPVKVKDFKIYSGSIGGNLGRWLGRISSNATFSSDVTNISSEFALTGSSPVTINMDLTGNYAFKRFFELRGAAGTGDTLDANSRFDEIEWTSSLVMQGTNILNKNFTIDQVLSRSPDEIKIYTAAMSSRTKWEIVTKEHPEDSFGAAIDTFVIEPTNTLTTRGLTGCKRIIRIQGLEGALNSTDDIFKEIELRERSDAVLVENVLSNNGLFHQLGARDYYSFKGSNIMETGRIHANISPTLELTANTSISLQSSVFNVVFEDASMLSWDGDRLRNFSEAHLEVNWTLSGSYTKNTAGNRADISTQMVFRDDLNNIIYSENYPATISVGGDLNLYNVFAAGNLILPHQEVLSSSSELRSGGSMEIGWASSSASTTTITFTTDSVFNCTFRRCHVTNILPI